MLLFLGSKKHKSEARNRTAQETAYNGYPANHVNYQVLVATAHGKVDDTWISPTVEYKLKRA